MDQTLSYTDILTQVMHDEEQYQPMHGPKIVSASDPSRGQFLLIAVGFQGPRYYDSILFHAQLLNGKVRIETDNTEEGLSSALIEAGIRAEDLLSGRDADRLEAVPLAA